MLDFNKGLNKMFVNIRQCLQMHFLNRNEMGMVQISLHYAAEGPTDNDPDNVMLWCLIGDRPKQMMIQLTTVYNNYQIPIN